MSAKYLFSVAILALFIITATGQRKHNAEGLNRRDLEQKIIEKLFQPSYNKEVAPWPETTNETSPTIVNVNFYVRSIEFIDDVNMEYSMQLTFRQQWFDNRLVYNDVKLPENFPFITLRGHNPKIWAPDLFFSNERSAKMHDVPFPNSYVRIFPNGEVLSSSRITLKLSCPMIFKNYPFDNQMCTLRFASYGYTTNDIIFKWKKSDPIQVTSDLHLPKFSLKQFTSDYCDSTTNTGTYSCLRAEFIFKRESQYYVSTLFFPSIFIIIIAWSSFWISRQQTTSRILILLFSLATMLNLTRNFQMVGTSMSYTKASDIWTTTCLLFVLFAHLEFMTVHYISKNEAEKEAQLERRGFKMLKSPKTWFKESRWGEIIDIISRIGYFLAFVIFSLCYFGTYCRAEEDEFGV